MIINGNKEELVPISEAKELLNQNVEIEGVFKIGQQHRRGPLLMEVQSVNTKKGTVTLIVVGVFTQKL